MDIVSVCADYLFVFPQLFKTHMHVCLLNRARALQMLRNMQI